MGKIGRDYPKFALELDTTFIISVDDEDNRTDIMNNFVMYLHGCIQEYNEQAHKVRTHHSRKAQIDEAKTVIELRYTRPDHIRKPRAPRNTSARM